MRMTTMEINFGKTNLNHITRNIYSPNFLSKIYGPDSIIGEWDNKERIIKFDRPISDGMPRILRPFVPHKKVNINIKQSIIEERDRYHHVVSKMHFNTLGSHLLHIETSFITSENEVNETIMNICVKVRVSAPPFIRGKVENFMEREAKKDLAMFETLASKQYI
jgi:hypothetical protein